MRFAILLIAAMLAAPFTAHAETIEEIASIARNDAYNAYDGWAIDAEGLSTRITETGVAGWAYVDLLECIAFVNAGLGEELCVNCQAINDGLMEAVDPGVIEHRNDAIDDANTAATKVIAGNTAYNAGEVHFLATPGEWQYSIHDYAEARAQYVAGSGFLAQSKVHCDTFEAEMAPQMVALNGIKGAICACETCVWPVGGDGEGEPEEEDPEEPDPEDPEEPI